ncbi:adenylate/guanylate cyclase domain-containing protein [Dermatophilus congolensis]|uniref:pH-sensitive adenylate cyclase Rv1264 n=1 Tax=Dermatophilus congolensis TaxID=1863 RepID=A0A239VDF6_9MICO|nr:adenylate/guanylate cyclase domain-containing protein [Dermatophilus congolensis]MBO3128550.1 adenylate/guanylate cyclase domain-containing protein [Dermatophilus congolensis]MBO3132813.1 adenylate/guanylate cyclase domain-containing protein [Dermatophilus congolensis]MBO3133028.1 adenylate/guanylate cyclase domain-containing protein [Dermatophilus congolensis]MBO3135261.1 adenylate/guanylate cyclase domain-containing protein [Dermatophilus congolensis]MBO3137502.1 adenylate/guanylate cycla
MQYGDREEKNIPTDPKIPSATTEVTPPRPYVVLHETLRRIEDRYNKPTPLRTSDAATRRADIIGQLLGTESPLRRREVARTARLPFITARRVWHALGFPELGARSMPFTQADLNAIPDIAELRRLTGMNDDLVLDIARAIARSTDRLATWQTSLMMELVASRRHHDEQSRWTEQLTPQERETVINRILEASSSIEPILIYAWRRHLAAALAQLVDDDEATTKDGLPANARTIGFADLVGFTSTVANMNEREISALVGEFETLASDIVTIHGGKIVKTIGDEILFACDRPAAAGAIGLDLIDALHDMPGMPQLRVGISTGAVVSQFGDVFGTTVNRASRLTAAAEPGTVVIDTATQTRLTTVSGFELMQLEPTPLRGLGLTQMWALRRSTTPKRRGPTDARTVTE